MISLAHATRMHGAVDLLHLGNLLTVGERMSANFCIVYHVVALGVKTAEQYTILVFSVL